MASGRAAPAGREASANINAYPLRIGIHTSIAGSLDKAAAKAAELGANTFQIFSASPRMWAARPPRPEEIRRMREARQEFGLEPLVIHDNYLINLAAADETKGKRWRKGSRASPTLWRRPRAAWPAIA